MKTLFNPDSFLMRFLSRVADMMLLNALWVISCLPIITIGAATTAMYHVTLKLAKGEEEGIFKTYWRGFRANFLPATKVFLILLVPMLIVVADVAVLLTGALGKGWIIICVLPAAVFAMIWAYAFPLVAKFDNEPMTTVKNAMLLSIGNFPRSIVMVVLNMLPIIWLIAEPISFFRYSVVLVLGGFAWIAYGNGILLHKIFDSIIQTQTAEKAEEKITADS